MSDIIFSSTPNNPRHGYIVMAKTPHGKPVRLGLNGDDIAINADGLFHKVSYAMDELEKFVKKNKRNPKIDPATIKFYPTTIYSQNVTADIEAYKEAKALQKIVAAAESTDLGAASNKYVKKKLESIELPVIGDVQFPAGGPGENPKGKVETRTVWYEDRRYDPQAFSSMDDVLLYDPRSPVRIEKTTIVRAPRALTPKQVEKTLLEEAKNDYSFGADFQEIANPKGIVRELRNARSEKAYIEAPEGVFAINTGKGEPLSWFRSLHADISHAANSREEARDGNKPLPSIHAVNFEVTQVWVPWVLMSNLSRMLYEEEFGNFCDQIRNPQQREVVRRHLESNKLSREALLEPFSRLAGEEMEKGYWVYSETADPQKLVKERSGSDLYHVVVNAGINYQEHKHGKERALTIAFIKPSLGEAISEDSVDSAIGLEAAQIIAQRSGTDARTVQRTLGL